MALFLYSSLSSPRTRCALYCCREVTHAIRWVTLTFMDKPQFCLLGYINLILGAVGADCDRAMVKIRWEWRLNAKTSWGNQGQKIKCGWLSYIILVTVRMVNLPGHVLHSYLFVSNYHYFVEISFHFDLYSCFLCRQKPKLLLMTDLQKQ